MIFMKNIKNIISFCLIFSLVFSLFALTGCGSGEKEYAVSVKDAFGTPYTSGVIVKFMDGDDQVAMQSINDKGIATKTIQGGSYRIVLDFTDSDNEYYYDNSIEVTEDSPKVDVIVSYKVGKESEKLSTNNGEFDAPFVNAGGTYVNLKEKSRNYFLFSPKQAGNYEISVINGKDIKIGYYGAPHFVQENSVAEVKDNKFSINVKANMIGTNGTGTSTYVIGLDAGKGVKNCILGINRVGEPIKSVEDEPWTVYKKTVELSNYKLPANLSIKEFDLTASTDTYKFVFNDKDGFYHLNSDNGPIVLVRLAKDCKYIACFKTMLDRSGVSKYFFDEKKNFIKKESYSECLLEYIEYVDEDNGVYPLTKDLKYIIEQRGEYVGWWNPEGNGYMFKDDSGNNLTNINNEIAWLFMCCYAE